MERKHKVFLSVLRLNENSVLADLVPSGSAGMLAGMQHGDIGAAVPLWGHWAGVSRRLCWEGSSFQSKLEALRVGWRCCELLNIKVLVLCAHRELKYTFLWCGAFQVENLQSSFPKSINQNYAIPSRLQLP